MWGFEPEMIPQIQIFGVRPLKTELRLRKKKDFVSKMGLWSLKNGISKPENVGVGWRIGGAAQKWTFGPIQVGFGGQKRGGLG